MIISNRNDDKKERREKLRISVQDLNFFPCSVAGHYTPYLSTWACYRFLPIKLSHHQNNSVMKCTSAPHPIPPPRCHDSSQEPGDALGTIPLSAGIQK